MKSAAAKKYSDTTVKLEASVVREICGILSEKQTITAFVREAVERDIRRHKMRAAAALYREVLSGNPSEAAESEAWESADLAAPVQKRTRRS